MINFGLSLKNKWCAPSVSAPWNKDLANYLISQGGRIGILQGKAGNMPRDFQMTELCEDGSEKIIINGECKRYTAGVSCRETPSIITKLNEFTAPINIIAVSYTHLRVV